MPRSFRVCVVCWLVLLMPLDGAMACRWARRTAVRCRPCPVVCCDVAPDPCDPCGLGWASGGGLGCAMEWGAGEVEGTDDAAPTPPAARADEDRAAEAPADGPPSVMRSDSDNTSPQPTAADMPLPEEAAAEPAKTEPAVDWIPLQPATEPSEAAADLTPVVPRDDDAATTEPPAEDARRTLAEPALDDLFDAPAEDRSPPDAADPQPQGDEGPTNEPMPDTLQDDSLDGLFDSSHRPDGRGSAGDGPRNLEVRRWTDDTGVYSCQGRLVRILDGRVRILKATGRTTTVPLARLSHADRRFVQAQSRAALASLRLGPVARSDSPRP